MTSRKTAADNEGWKKGVGKHSDVDAGLKRGPTSWDYPVTTDGYTGSDAKAKHTSDSDAGLRRSKTDPENYAAVDIWDLADSQSGKTGPVVLRKRDQDR